MSNGGWLVYWPTGGLGVLEVDCTVSIGGQHSDCHKWLFFRAGEVVFMRREMLS